MTQSEYDLEEYRRRCMADPKLKRIAANRKIIGEQAAIYKREIRKRLEKLNRENGARKSVIWNDIARERRMKEAFLEEWKVTLKGLINESDEGQPDRVLHRILQDSERQAQIAVDQNQKPPGSQSDSQAISAPITGDSSEGDTNDE